MKLQAIGASVQGTSRICTDLPGQDSQEYRIFSDECLLAAVADGLGTALHLEEGAKIAIIVALDSLEKILSNKVISNSQPWSLILKNAFSNAAQKINETAIETVSLCANTVLL